MEISHNPNWLDIPDYPPRILIIGCSGSGKTNVLLNLIKYQHPDVDKIYLYAKNPCKTKYPLIINGTEKTGIKYEKNPKTFIDYLQWLMISMEI